MPTCDQSLMHALTGCQTESQLLNAVIHRRRRKQLRARRTGKSCTCCPGQPLRQRGWFGGSGSGSNIYLPCPAAGFGRPPFQCNLSGTEKLPAAAQPCGCREAAVGCRPAQMADHPGRNGSSFSPSFDLGSTKAWQCLLALEVGQRCGLSSTVPCMAC